MKRLDETRLQPGDIILTGGHSKISGAVRKALGGTIAHALLYVQNCSVIDSTLKGVRASNTQRMFFEDSEAVIVVRMDEPLGAEALSAVLDYARVQVGTRYAPFSAARSRRGTGPRGEKRQFCSRLVARAYATAGVEFHDDTDYCSPQHLVDSALLVEVPNATVSVSDAEVERWRRHPDGVAHFWAAQDRLLDRARRLDRRIETFQDLVEFVIAHPEKDERVSRLLGQSGYLDAWRFDTKHNPWRFDPVLMLARPPNDMDIYCQALADDEPGGGERFFRTLATLEDIPPGFERTSIRRLKQLYRQLCTLHMARVSAARHWLTVRRHSRAPRSISSKAYGSSSLQDMT